MKKHFFKILTFLALMAINSPTADAQCPMCRMTVESNLKAGGSTGKGLNTGILFMLSMPYLLVGTIGFIWWKNRRKEVDETMN